MTGSYPDAPQHAERRTRLVAALTALTMLVEIATGWWFNSMALLADGWHMGTHAVAIGLAAVAYGLARRYRSDPRFAFGPWKIEVLAAFASAVALIGVALGMVGASVERLLQPQRIGYADAMAVAVLGLVVNLVCAWLLGPHDHGAGHQHHHGADHDHDHSHSDPHPHPHAEPTAAHAHAHAHASNATATSHAATGDHHHGDLNLRSAYMHVLADAATSALAIVALGGGLLFGWAWLDPAMGIVGAVMVGRWGVLLVRDTARVLLDREMDSPLANDVRHTLQDHAPWAARARLQDLRVWRVGRDSHACIVKLAGTQQAAVTPAEVRQFLARWPTLDQVTVQIEPAAPH